jgi:hypothetical protein
MIVGRTACLLVWVIGLGSLPSLQAAQEEQDYQILWIDESPENYPVSNISYRVSVEDRLEKEHLERLICQIIDREQPGDVDMLSIHFYYRLKDFLYARSKKRFERNIGAYYWNRQLPGNRHRLRIYQDKSGQDFKPARRYPFDHTKDCPELER